MLFDLFKAFDNHETSHKSDIFFLEKTYLTSCVRYHYYKYYDIVDGTELRNGRVADPDLVNLFPQRERIRYRLNTKIEIFSYNKFLYLLTKLLMTTNYIS